MPEISITIEPTLSSLASKFKGRADVLEREVQSATEKAAFTIERMSKIKTPVDTGRLRASIFTTIMPLKATIQPNTDYAIYVHDGTRYMRARPFMKEGLLDSIQEIRQDFNNAVRRSLNS